MSVEEQEQTQQPEQEIFPAAVEEASQDMKESLERLRPFARIPFEVSIELGRSKIKIEDLLNIRYHSVFVLEKLAGNNLDILVNGVLLARGEVIVDERVRIKINEIVDNRE